MRSTMSILTALVLTGASASAQLQQQLTASKDNTLYQTADGSTSNGVGSYLFAGRVAATGGGAIRRALIKFDVSTIPAGATITSASLRLNMSKTNNGAQTMILKRLTADWGEGTSNADANEGSGAPSTTGDATWIHRFSATASWATPGAATDVAGPTSASASINSIGAYTWSSTPQMVADVQGWLNNPASNFGWILIGEEESSGTSKRFDSREHETTANRPRLTIQYTTSTSVSDAPTVPDRLALEGNYPNPFNPETTIGYRVSGNGDRVSLRVFNLFGQEVATLVNEPHHAGIYSSTWYAYGMPSGIYFAVLESGALRDVKRMILAK
jgi:hypothetical protein